MFNFIHRLFHAKEKAVDVTSINDPHEYIRNTINKFNCSDNGEQFQARKWGK